MKKKLSKVMKRSLAMVQALLSLKKLRKQDRLCYYCRHFYMSEACPGYSEYTPGSSWSMSCYKNVWDFDNYSCTEEEFAACLECAKTCEFFEEKQSAKT